MEGLRGLAIFLVFLVHYVTLMEPWIVTQSTLRSIATALHTIGNTGVDLFFVLSGYLIYGSLITRPQRFGRFMARRIERIYPTFAVVFVIYVGLSFLLPAQSKIPAGFSSAARSDLPDAANALVPHPLPPQRHRAALNLQGLRDLQVSLSFARQEDDPGTQHHLLRGRARSHPLLEP